ncbi:MAG: DUF3604 domain-containing protein [Pseudomonadales bacterium]
MRFMAQLPVLLVFSLCVIACAERQSGGAVSAPAVSQAAVAERKNRQQSVQPQAREQILFGDLHVHTTFSPDAFITAMPVAGGRGLTPPATACDFARYCSALDFWSINDHAEGVTPQRWQDTKDVVRQCNAVAGDPENPDIVAFLGWEWSQVNTDPSKHFGHKNVIFLDTEDDKVPTRAIASPREKLNKAPMGRIAQWMMALGDFENRDYYFGIDTYYSEIAETPICEPSVDTRDLPSDCLEVANTPADLFEKLNQWNFDALVIPHGNAWGLNTPPTTSFNKQLTKRYHDTRLQTLFEVYSGHGNSEEYRPWAASVLDDQGNGSCPSPSDDYLPCCWQAGNIIAQRCAAEGADDIECSNRAARARQNFVDAGISGHLTVPGQELTDWLNCGQCKDCFAEGMDHRPKTTAQYALAITNFDNPQEPLRFRFGFIGSSDNHGAAPGTGYKEFERRQFTDGMSPAKERMANNMMRDSREAIARSIPLSEVADVSLNKQRNMERQASFWMTGGLVAVHSDGRNRQSIWDGLSSKNVYATSGDRTLLWFDEVSEPSQPKPMGSELQRENNPRFKVSAVGAFEQLPGCPDHAVDALGTEQLQTLCSGECYNPSDQRKTMKRIEVVRILPQASPEEDVADLIEDPWKTFQCDPDSVVCNVEFSDEQFLESGREAVYYVRAIQEASDAINGGGLRCEYDVDGNCIKVNPCYAGPRTAANDDCLAPLEERAWSSPIFVSPAVSQTNNTSS